MPCFCGIGRRLPRTLALTASAGKYGQHTHECEILGTLETLSYSMGLFFSHEYGNGDPLEVKMLPNLIFEITLVRVLYILRKVTEESKLRVGRRQLGAKLDFDVFAFCAGGG